MAIVCSIITGSECISLSTLHIMEEGPAAKDVKEHSIETSSG